MFKNTVEKQIYWIGFCTASCSDTSCTPFVSSFHFVVCKDAFSGSASIVLSLETIAMRFFFRLFLFLRVSLAFSGFIRRILDIFEEFWDGLGDGRDTSLV